MSQSISIEQPDTNSQQKKFPGFWASVGWTIAFFALQGAAGFIAISAVADGRPIAEVLKDYKLIALPSIWATIAYGFVFVALLHLYLRKDNRYARIGLDRWSRLSFVKTFGLAALLIGVGMAANYVYSAYIVPDVKMQEQLRLIISAIPDNAVGQISLFLTVVVVAPITEELAFRGILQNGLKNWMPVWLAIPLSAMVFSAAHADYYAFVPLAVMGMAFGILYHKTGSLRANIALHALNNAAALALS
jgi:membrane protease YdiL (CAAX protease family)